MSNKINTYLRCVYANKVTLLGFCLMVAGILIFLSLNAGLEISDSNRNLLGNTIFGVGLIISAMTRFGLETYATYMKISDHIKKTGKVGKYDSQFHFYCNTCAIRLAIDDSESYLKNQ